MKSIPTNVSQSTRKRNPHLYGTKNISPVGRVETKKPERPAAQTLDSGLSQQQGREESVYHVTFVTFRKRLLDSDNAVGAIKPLRDSVAMHLDIDDGSERIKWEYHQVETKGKEGCIVKIEML
jgi:hypothetical protein